MRNRVILGIAVAALAIPVAPPAGADNDKALVARGKYLVMGPALCANCHTQRGADLKPVMSKFLVGGEKFTSPVFVTYSRNITPDKDTGIGTWTDAQIIRAFREGVSREGKTLGPPMPFEMLNKMSDDDAKAIVAYLRTAKPMHNEVPEPQYKIPLKPEPAAKGEAAPPKTDKVAYGRYYDHGALPRMPHPAGRAGARLRTPARGWRIRVRIRGRARQIAQHHVGQGHRHREHERRPDQAGDHRGHRPRGQEAHPADALSVPEEPHRRGPRRHRGLYPHPAADQPQERAQSDHRVAGEEGRGGGQH